MAIRETLNAKPVTLADVLSNGKRYIVPPFQRDYAWEEPEWSELWADLEELSRATSDRENHYLGAIVLQPTGVRSDSNIIDGQQRLVTLSLLALAVIRSIDILARQGQDPDNNRERARILREKFVSTKDSASLQHRSRLKLNDNDNSFYQTYLVQGVEPSRPAALKGSEGRLYKAFAYFSGKVTSLLGAQASGSQLASFLEETVAVRLRFIEIVVEDDDTAFTVFETLNARGVALGTADLLKNFVFSIAAKGGRSDLEQARIWWDQILRLVPMDQVATFLFHKLAGSVPELREKRVFAEVKHIVPLRKTVFEFLREMKEAAEIYAALDDPNSEFWSEFPEAKRHVRVLELLRVEQSRPVVLAAIPRLAERPEKVARLLRNLVIISLRAKVARVNTGDLQRVYHVTAQKIERGELKSPLAIARSLSPIMPSDDEFRTSFGQLSLDPKGPNKRLVRYLLAELEAAFGGQVIDFDASDATIEHILPENPGEGWEAFSAEDRLRDVRRLGNLTPLEGALNRGLGTAIYARKRIIYERSRYCMTQQIDVTEWTPGSIRVRQQKMAEMAALIWKIESEEQ